MSFIEIQFDSSVSFHLLNRRGRILAALFCLEAFKRAIIRRSE